MWQTEFLNFETRSVTFNPFATSSEKSTGSQNSLHFRSRSLSRMRNSVRADSARGDLSMLAALVRTSESMISLILSTLFPTWSDSKNVIVSLGSRIRNVRRLMVSKVRLSFFGHHAADFSYQVGQADFPLQYSIQIIAPEQKEVFMPLARSNGIVRKSGTRNGQS